MSEAFTPLTVSEAVAAANRIFDRADAALTIARALDGVSHRELLSIVILARQLDAIARAAAQAETRMRPLMRKASPEAAGAAGILAGQLFRAGYLPLPEPQPAEEPAHGEG